MAKKLNKNLVIGLAALGFTVTTAAGVLMVFQLKQTDPKEFVARAESLAKEKNWKEAAVFYGQAYNITKEPGYLVLAGDMQTEAGNEREARMLYGNAVMHDPNLLPAQEKLLKINLQYAEMFRSGAEVWTEVQKTAQAVLELQKDHPRATYALGMSFLGLKELDAGNEEEGVKTLQRAIELAPTDVDATRGLAQYYLNHNRKEEAEALLNNLVKATTVPGRDAALARCLLAMRISAPDQKRTDEAEKVLEDALKMAGDDPEVLAKVYYYIGDYWLDKWNDQTAPARTAAAANNQKPPPEEAEATAAFDKAVAAFQKAIEVAPDEFDAYLQLAQAYRAHNDVAEAKSLLEKRIEMKIKREGLKANLNKQSRYRALLLLAEIYTGEAGQAKLGSPEQEKSAEQADRYVEFALGEFPNEPSALEIRGRIRFAVGKYREAVLELQQAQDLARRPNWMSSYFLAKSLLQLGQAGEARSAMLKGIEDPTASLDCWVLLAQISLQLNEPQNALEAAQQVLNRQPDYRQALLLKATAQEQLGMKPDEALERFGDEPAILAARAHLLAQEGKTAEGLALLAPVLEKDPSNYPAVRAAAQINHLAENKAAVKQVLDAALAAAPANFDIQLLALQFSDRSPEEREQEFVRMVEALPDEYERATRLAMYYDGVNKREESREQLNKAVEMILAGSSESARAAGETRLRNIVDRLFQFAIDKKDTAEMDRLVQMGTQQNLDVAEGLSYKGRRLMMDGLFAQQDAEAAAAAGDMAKAEGLRKQARAAYEKAITALKQAIDKFPSSGQTYAQLGEAYLQTQRIDDARVAFEQASEKQPMNGAILRRLADIAQRSNDDAAFRELLAKCRRIIPEDPWVVEQSLVEAAEADPRDVISQREKRRESNPEDISNLYRLADLYRKIGDTDLAQQRLDQMLALRLDISTADPAARLLREMNKPDEALKILQQHQRQAPPENQVDAQLLIAAEDIAGTPRVLSVIGAHYLRTGRPKEALGWFDKALAAPDDGGMVDRSAIRVMRIDTMLQLDQIVEAEAEVAALLKERPDDAWGLLLEAQVVQASGRTEEAITKLTNLLNKYPGDAKTIMRRAELQFGLGRWEACISGLESLRASSPSAMSYSPRILLARALAKTGKEDLALRDLDTILKENPTAQNVAAELVGIYMRRAERADEAKKPAEFAQADALITAMLSRNPRSVSWLMEAAKLATLQKDRGKALGAFRQAAEISGYHPSITLELLRACRKDNLDAAQQGIVYFEQTVPPGQRDASLTLAYAQLVAELGDEEASIEAFRLAGQRAGYQSLSFLDLVAGSILQTFGGPKARELLEQAPTDEVFQRINRHLLCEVLRVTGDLDGAEKAANELLASPIDEQESGLSHLHLARIHEDRAQFEAAQKEYEAVLQVDPNNLVALNNIAYLLTDKLDRPKEAVPYARRAAQVSPRAEVLDTLGWAYFKSNEFGEAAAQFMKVRTMDPDYVPVMAHLGETYRRQGNFKDAIELFNMVTSAPTGGMFDDYRKMAEEGLQKANSQIRD